MPEEVCFIFSRKTGQEFAFDVGIEHLKAMADLYDEQFATAGNNAARGRSCHYSASAYRALLGRATKIGQAKLAKEPIVIDEAIAELKAQGGWNEFGSPAPEPQAKRGPGRPRKDAPTEADALGVGEGTHAPA